MKLINSSAAESKLEGDFNEVRERLLADTRIERLNRPLAYWTLPDDRCLPLAFMGVAVRELVEMPFSKLYSTPGVGAKKVGMLIQVLCRAANGWTPPGLIQEASNQHPSAEAAEGDAIDPDQVSESLWSHWCQTIVRHGLEGERLGCVAGSLFDLPKTAWRTPFGRYTTMSLEDVRQLKGHGEKRVRMILRTFGEVYQTLGTRSPAPHLKVRLATVNIRAAEDWLLRAISSQHVPTAAELHEGWIRPLCDQLRIDSGEEIAELIEHRVRCGASGKRIDRAAKRLALTRARIYQLLGEVGTIMELRWAAGSALCISMQQKLSADEQDRQVQELFTRAADVFFPQSPSELQELITSAVG